MSLSEIKPGQSAADQLRATVSGGVAIPSDAAYADACTVWNAAVHNRPAMVAFCRQAQDVAAAVRVARRHGLPLSVRGGGHDWTGRAIRSDAVVIDLTGMRDVAVDARTRVATVACGATIRDVLAAAEVHGLVAVSGSCNDVGMAGLTLGGGYGLLNGSYGLSVDNLLGAEIVLADGRIVAASPEAEPDLFWAIRGGGGNFGVVTSMRLRLHQPRTLLGGAIVYPMAAAGAVLRRYADFTASMPDELGAVLAMMPGEDGQPAVLLAPLWNGGLEEGQHVVADLQAWATPQMAHVGPTSYTTMLSQFDAMVQERRHWALQTRWLPALSEGAIDALVAAIARRTSPYSFLVLHDFHGAAARVAPDATAFGLRREHFLVEIIAGWNADGDDGAPHRQWARDVSRSLAPFALPGGYANLLGPDDREQVADAYGGNATRLRALKRRFDPDGIFTSAIPLPESAPSNRT